MAHQKYVSSGRRTIEKIGVAQNYYNAKLYDGQEIAEIVLDAQGKLGKILSDIPKKRDKQSSTRRTSLPSLPLSITKKESHIAQSVAKIRRNRILRWFAQKKRRIEAHIGTLIG